MVRCNDVGASIADGLQILAPDDLEPEQNVDTSSIGLQESFDLLKRTILAHI